MSQSDEKGQELPIYDRGGQRVSAQPGIDKHRAGESISGREMATRVADHWDGFYDAAQADNPAPVKHFTAEEIAAYERESIPAED